MKTLTTFLLITGLLATGCTSGVDVAKQPADFSLSAIQLINDFEADEQAANQKYLDKIIETVGHIAGIEKLANGTNQLILETGSMGNVQCNLDDGQSDLIASLAIDKTVKIKGICMGMLLDVVLEDCVIMKN